MQNGWADIFTVDLATEEVTNLTKDEIANYAPTFAPDGRSIVYLARISGNEKLFSLDLASGKKTQLTFGTHDDAAARFLDADTLIFASTAADPNKPIEPEVARNGAIFNIWTLGLKTGELRQFTDAVGGNFSPVVLKDESTTKIAFITYYKGDYQLHAVEKKDAIVTAASADFGAPGPIIDFQAPLNHTLITENKTKKGSWDKMFLEGRPPVNVGVTSGGNFFGSTAVSFADVLGDRRIDAYFGSMSQYRVYGASLINLEHRLNYAIQGYWQDQFYYGQTSGVYYDPVYAPYIDRDLATSTRSNRGASAFGIYPLEPLPRIEFSGGFGYIREQYNDPLLEELANEYQQQAYGNTLYRNGWYVPLSVSFVQETTIFREFGPLSGSTMRLTYEIAPAIGDQMLSWQTVDVDVRKYFKIGSSALLALRGRGFRSWGDTPSFTYFGGNSDLRGYDYLEFAGQNGVYGNAEFRVPADQRHGDADRHPRRRSRRGVLRHRRRLVGQYGLQVRDERQPGHHADRRRRARPGDRQPRSTRTATRWPITGFRLVDGRASYGLGVETMALGFPIHFDWSWRTLFNESWENACLRERGQRRVVADSRASSSGLGSTSRPDRGRAGHTNAPGCRSPRGVSRRQIFLSRSSARFRSIVT